MYSSNDKSRSKFQKRVSHGLPPESLEEKRRRILSGLSVTRQKRRMGKKVTFYAAGYKPWSIRYNNPSGSRSNAVGLTQEKVNFRSRIPVSKLSQTSVSHVPIASTPSTFYKFHRQLDTNPFFNNDFYGRATHAANLSGFGCNQQNLFTRKREDNNFNAPMKLMISLKRIKTEYSEPERIERCLALEKECLEMLEYLQKWISLSGRFYWLLFSLAISVFKILIANLFVKRERAVYSPWFSSVVLL